MTLITPEGQGERLYSSCSLIVVNKEEKWLSLNTTLNLKKICDQNKLVYFKW